MSGATHGYITGRGEANFGKLNSNKFAVGMEMVKPDEKNPRI